MCKHDDTIEDDIVLKMVKPHSDISREIDNLLELQDEPHIIHILKFKGSNLCGQNYFAMSRCKGGDLYEYISRNKVTEQDIIIITNQLIQAIRECHKHRIVHGDIKLENIGLVNENDISDIKLLDFGGSIKISKDDEICDPRNLDLQLSPHYIPPEMLIPHKQPIKTMIYIDFWELGVVIYTLLTGRFPYGNCRHIVQRKVPWPKSCGDISPRMKNAVESLLVKSPEQRYNIDEFDLF
jgi:serine/threonine protein kinase